MTTDTSVLVIDDDPLAITVASGHLAHVGITCTGVASVDAAIAALDTDLLPDVIISDVMMPERDGFDLCRHIREDDRLAHLPIVFVTGMGDRDARIRALDTGADDLLVKPVDDIELVARVRSLANLSRQRYRNRQRNRFDAILAHVADGVVVADVHGGVMDSNGAVQRFLGNVGVGADLEASWGAAGFVSIDRPPMSAVALAPGDQLLHRSGNGPQETVLRVRSSVVRDPQGRPEARVFVFRDVTDEVRSARTSQLVMSSISHKFRTPLTGLVGALDILSRGEQDPVQERVLSIASRAVDRLQETLIRITDVAHTAGAAQQESIVLEPRGVDDLLVELLPNHPDVARRVVVDLARPIEVPGTALRVALSELTSNAVRAASEPGQVRVALVQVEDELVLTVRDNGPGLAWMDVDRAFGAFFQTDRTGEEPGLGLGLPLVRHVVEDVGGTISMETSPDGSTAFEVVIPVSRYGLDLVG